MANAGLGNYFSVREYGPNNSRPIFIFGGWLTRPFFYSRLIRHLTRNNFRCVLYIPKRKLIAIGTEYGQVVRAAHLVLEDVREQLTSNDEPAAVFGVSFGTAFALEVAKQCPQIKRIVLIAPPGDFKKHIEIWQYQPYLKKIVASQPTQVTESGRILNKIGALNKLEALKNKAILIGFVKNDQIMHYAIAKELVHRLHELGIEPTVIEVKGSHNLGLIRYIFHKAYLHFLLDSDKTADAFAGHPSR